MTDVQILGVSTDTRADSMRMNQIVKGLTGLDLTFPLLADTGHKVIDRYGLLNMHTVPGPSTRWFATPATFVVDKAGIVRWRFADENWKLRPTNELLMAALERVRRGQDVSDLTLASLSKHDPAELPKIPFKRASTVGMVLIPGGAFLMGQESRFMNDSAAHKVDLDSYYMDKYEATNRQYRRFLEYMSKTHDHSRCYPTEAPHKDHTPKFWNDPRFNQDDFPVVGVDWYDAYAYCAWAGKQLPTEAQWEKAARGGQRESSAGGETGLEVEKLANINPENSEVGTVYQDRGTPLPINQHGPKPVGSYPPNGYGLYDMRGNAEEWVRDWYSQDYYQHSPPANPVGPDHGVLKVVRGGSWDHGLGKATTRYTHEPNQREEFLGFRCVLPVQRWHGRR
jgi:formylglycine-generating enzyme required for sulfatase activity